MSLSARILAAAATSIATSIAAPFALQDAPQRIAFVDSRRILDQAPGRAEADLVLQKEYTTLQGRVKQLNDALAKSVADYQGLPAATPQAEKDRRLKAVQDEQVALQQKEKDFDAQFSARQGEMIQPFVDQVKLVLEDLRSEGKWTFILEGGQGGSIVAADKNLDITDRAIAKLRMLPKPALPAARGDSAAKKPVGAPLNAPAGVRAPGSAAPPPPRRPDTLSTMHLGALR